MTENKELEPPYITIRVLRFCDDCCEHTYSEPLTIKYQHNYFKKNYCSHCGFEYYMEIKVIEQ